MSNLERDPAELLAPPEPASVGGIELLEPREVPLGGPRAMPVRRTLPQRARTTIGAWCFVDHYGPDDVDATGGMVVPPHPHTGLQTVSWLFAGEIEHRDSTGSHALVQPGGVNLMTAGHGISHSEVSTPGTTTLHGVQLWVALPDGSRDVAPFFEHADTSAVAVDDATVRVFVGALAKGPADAAASVTVFSPLIGAQTDLPPYGTASIPLDPAFEHGVLADTGRVRLEVPDPTSAADAAADVPFGHLAYVPTGRERLTLRADDEPVRVVLIGGVPFGEQLVMWWNFIGRTHEEVVAFRAAWQGDVIEGRDPAGRFGTVAGYDGRPLPAPELPTVRLKPRG